MRPLAALSADDEKRLDAVDWLCGAFLRSVRADFENRDVAIWAVADRGRVELLCEDASYADLPNLLDCPEGLRLAGLVVQPLPGCFNVRLEFSNHPAQVNLRCLRVLVRRHPLAGEVG